MHLQLPRRCGVIHQHLPRFNTYTVLVYCLPVVRTDVDDVRCVVRPGLIPRIRFLRSWTVGRFVAFC